MKKLIPLLFILIAGAKAAFGQTDLKITDVSFWLENKLIFVEYSIVGALPEEKFTIELKFISETEEVILPKSLTGDFGKNITPGKGKMITWDYVSDRFEFSGNMKAVVTIVTPAVNSRGPYYALLSVAVPGLGGHFVQENKIRPYATTAVTAGLLTYGIIMKSKANKYYEDYKQCVDYADFASYYDKANSAHHKYYIATRIAAVVWIADIIWVFNKGRKNVKGLKSGSQPPPGSGLTIDYGNNEFQIGYRLTF